MNFCLKCGRGSPSSEVIGTERIKGEEACIFIDRRGRDTSRDERYVGLSETLAIYSLMQVTILVDWRFEIRSRKSRIYLTAATSVYQ